VPHAIFDRCGEFSFRRNCWLETTADRCNLPKWLEPISNGGFLFSNLQSTPEQAGIIWAKQNAALGFD
jgi:hypothetical protein